MSSLVAWSPELQDAVRAWLSSCEGLLERLDADAGTSVADLLELLSEHERITAALYAAVDQRLPA